MFTIRVIFFDTETSGLDCLCCNIIELAMLTVIDGEITEKYDKFVNIGKKLHPQITQITGITNEMLETRGVGEKEIAMDLKRRLSEGTLMIAHNAQFDLSFVYFLLKRHFPDEADEIVANVDWIDTLSILKDRKTFPHKLCDAVEHYGIDEVNFHRAIDDTLALYDVTKAMKAERNDLEKYKNIFGFNPKFGVSGFRFPFIKYKPQPYQRMGVIHEERILPKR